MNYLPATHALRHYSIFNRFGHLGFIKGKEIPAMSKSLKYTFLIHVVVSLIFGAVLLLAPGRFLGLFGWAPIDPLISRLLGAALLALAWSSYRGWGASSYEQVSVLVEMEVIFTVFGSVGLLRHLLKG
jgi:hypothetical protein